MSARESSKAFRPWRRAARSGAPIVGVLALLLAAPAPVLAVVPTPGGAVGVTSYGIGVDAGVDAFDPHVSGDTVSYTADANIRYYNFFTGADAPVPAPVGATDLLSDTNGGRIAFTRFFGGAARVMIYDVVLGTTIEIDPVASPLRFGSAIGSDTVAFIDQTPDPTGDLYAALLGGSTHRVTGDSRYTQNANVTPLGDAIVYESCASNPSDCSIDQASWNGSSWQVMSLTGDGLEDEANPDADGQTVVYDALRSADREIAWQPVGGGTEVVLSLSGRQRNPSISDGIVVFESLADEFSTADVFVYEIATNRLFQLTSTVGVDESLSDVVVLPDGTVRVVWAEGPVGDRDVRGADLVLPPVGPTYSFGGFQQPVDPRPTLNSVKAGGAVPVKSSLGGDRGLDVFAAGNPKSQVIACDSTADVDGIEQTVSAGASSLSYDPVTDLYSYIWKTDKSWAGTCRQLVLTFADGSVERANFKLK